ncbi:hypothetical protein RHSP_83472 [Rhizobium freirei PRF 81]|nr:hypothetical protein RTCIAT899_PB02645 [Rhizobium tropici CIAT 899]ENN86563.1 hypothetical protein RHSP_83472 [Rhizobium freirei PRF 81]
MAEPLLADRDRHWGIQVHHRKTFCAQDRLPCSRPKSLSAAPSSTACLLAHARNPSAVGQPRHRQPFQRSPSPQIPIHAPTPQTRDCIPRRADEIIFSCCR